MYYQTTLRLSARPRGFHLITTDIERALPTLEHCAVGLLHLFLQHTSASLAINENADPTVRADMERHFTRAVPEGAPYYQHTLEGADDMPAHIKAVTIGASLTIPVTDGRLNLGAWQGVYLGEHRDHAGPRSLIATLQGEWVRGADTGT